MAEHPEAGIGVNDGNFKEDKPFDSLRKLEQKYRAKPVQSQPKPQQLHRPPSQTVKYAKFSRLENDSIAITNSRSLEPFVAPA